jgi:hypothetical protein
LLLFLNAVGEKDVTTLTESHNMGRVNPNHTITAFVSGEPSDIFLNKRVFTPHLSSAQHEAIYTDIGDAVTATVKWASKRLRLVLFMLNNVANKRGIV